MAIPGRENPSVRRHLVRRQSTPRPMVGEAYVHVQGESLKAYAALLTEASQLPDHQGGEMKMGRMTGLFIFVVVMLLIAREGTRNHSSSGADSGADVDTTDLVRDKGFLAKSPTYIETTRRLIVSDGYDCEKIDFLWVKPPAPHGAKLEALCGAADADRVYVSQHYAVYLDTAEVNVCKPWEAGNDDCE